MVGKTISHYKILEKLGQGGMGVVYKAEDTKLKRVVALKFLPAELVRDDEAKQRFIKEAQAASALDHPNICTIHEINEMEDEQMFIAMACYQGGSLKAKMARGPLPINEAIDIAIEIAQGLSKAHSKEIVHRDIKPANILITEESQIKIVDFGLAKFAGRTMLTKSGSMLGTAAYMSPEQAQGSAVDQRTDIWALGVILYEMIAGEHPFKGEGELALMYEVVHKTPHSIRKVNADVPDELQRIIDKAMDKDVENRYQSVDEMLEKLEALKKALESGEQLSRGRYRLHTVRKIYRWLLPISVAAAVIIFLILKGGISQAETISIAVLPLEITGSFSEDDAWLTEAISRSIANKLTKLKNVQVTPWITSRRYGDYSNEIAMELAVQRIIVGNIQVLGERLYVSVELIDPNTKQQLWAGEFEGNISNIFVVQANIALRAAEELKGHLSGEEERLITRAPAQRADAYELYIKGSLEMQSDTPEDNNAALAYFDKAIELDPQLAEAYVGRGAVYGTRFFYGWGGMESFEKSEKNYKKALELDPQSTDARRGLINIFWEQGLSEECLKQGAVVSQDKLDDIGVLSVRTQAYLFGGLADKAVPLYERILQLDRANQGALWYLVIAHAWSLQWEKTIDAGELFFDRFGEDAEVHTWVACAHRYLGDFDAARVHIDRALTLFGDYPTDYVYAMASDIYKLLGDTVKANSLLTKSANLLRDKLQAYPSHFRILGALAEINARLGNIDETVKFVEYIIYRSQFGGFLEPVGLLVESGRAEKARQVHQNTLARGENIMFILNSGIKLRSDLISELKKGGFFAKQAELDSTYRARY